MVCMEPKDKILGISSFFIRKDKVIIWKTIFFIAIKNG